MKRLHYFNLLGVFVLGLLCIAQWTQNRQLNLEANRLERARLDVVAKLAEKEKAERDLNGDLADLKEHLSKSQTGENEAALKLAALEREVRHSAHEREQLMASVTNWAAAVSVRDQRLKQANEEIRRLGEELNTSIVKFNNLATNYNAVVKDLNNIQRQIREAGRSNSAAAVQ